MKSFSGSVKVKVAVGMKVQIDPNLFAGKLHAGKEFLIAGEPREVSGTECVPLNNLDGTRFSASYDLSMLQVTDLEPDLSALQVTSSAAFAQGWDDFFNSMTQEDCPYIVGDQAHADWRAGWVAGKARSDAQAKICVSEFEG